MLVVDNAHRREDLHVLVGLLAARSGSTQLLLVTRPGFIERLHQATAGTAFGAPGASREIQLLPLANASIGEIVREARPPLEFSGAVDEIVALAEGNPLIALLAHRVAVERGGLHGLSRGDVLGRYAESAVATAVERRPDVNADDLLDTLAVVSTLGPVGDGDHQLIADLLELPTRVVRNRLDDLADVGLLVDSGGQFAIVPDLLAAHVLRESYFTERTPAVRYADIWSAADHGRRARMCAALGGLQRFELTDRAGIGQLLAETLTVQAAAAPTIALSRAQSLAAGLPDVAVAVIDTVLAHPPDERRGELCRMAMEVLSRIGDFAAGWPRQLAVAQVCYASDYSEQDDKAMRDGLNQVYKRLPVNTSRFDWQVLAAVQETLDHITPDYWAEHRDERGCAMTVAVASRQLLQVVSERFYLSPEDEQQLRMNAGFLPAGERTGRVLRTGSRLLRKALTDLPIGEQHRAAEPLAALQHTAGGYVGPFGAMPSEELVGLAGDVIAENVTAYQDETDLDLPTKSRLVDALAENPWPDDEELREFRALFAHPARLDHDVAGAERAEAAATRLLSAENLDGELRRWQEWLTKAKEAQLANVGQLIIPQALAAAARTHRDRIGAALPGVLLDDGPLNEAAGPALVELLSGEAAEELAHLLVQDASAARRAALAVGLSGNANEWADAMLATLSRDPELGVRRTVARAVGWTTACSPARVITGLQACLPDDVVSALQMLFGLSARGVELHDRAAEAIDELAVNAACRPRVDALDLVEMVKSAKRPRAAVRAAVERVKWLMSEPDDPASLMARDSMPDELADVVRASGLPEDVTTVLNLIEETDLTSRACSAAVRLLSWLRDDADVVTDRMIDWLREEDSELEHVVRQLLSETKDAQRFKARAQRMLAATPPIDVAELLLEAREPIWTMGSERVIYRRIANEFDEWAGDDDERLAAVGRVGAARFRERATLAAGPDDDPDAEAG